MTMFSACQRFPVICALLSIATAQGETTAQTDLASITVAPLTRQADAKADWQTVYDYSGGADLPPGTRLTANGKWIDPLIRKDQSGVTLSWEIRRIGNPA